MRAGYVETYPCRTFKEAEGVMWALHRGQIKADMIVLDSLTGVVEKARQDLVMDPSQSKSSPIWDNREKLLPGRQEYYKTADIIKRLLRPIVELPIPSVFVCHERSRTDPLSSVDKYVPNLQREINENLFSFADAIVRLYPAPYPFEWAGQAVSAGTRLLLLSPSGDAAAGVRVAGDRPAPPPILVVPEGDPYSFGRFVEVVGAIPHNTVLYGPPKIGKTRFVSTAVYLQ